MIYRTFSHSAIGPKYSKKKWECQDSSGNSAENDFINAQVIAVADGHGSNDCFRSEVGSSIAIQILFEQVKLFCDSANLNISNLKFSDTGINNFKFSILQAWKDRVKADWDKRLQENEALGVGEIRFESITEKYRERFTSNDETIVEQYLYKAYGTTFIVAIAIRTQLLLMQIGDGTCVVLQQNGEFCVPIPPEEENFLNVTTSITDENAHQKIRHAVLDLNEQSLTMPVAVFLSSDGVDDCFQIYENEKHLYKLYTVILENIITKGFDSTEKQIIEQFLPGLTNKGSNDDISLAYLINPDIEVLKKAFDSIKEYYKPSIIETKKEKEEAKEESTEKKVLSDKEAFNGEEIAEKTANIQIPKEQNVDEQETLDTQERNSQIFRRVLGKINNLFPAIGKK